MHPVAAIAALLSLTTSSLAAPASYADTLTWKKCPTALVPANFTGVECGYMSVPMDWDNPNDGKTVKLGMVKLVAGDPTNKIGTIFYNPGGPGEEPSLDLTTVAAGTSSSRIRPELLNKFDIIGIDIRGTGLSDPIACSTELYNSQGSFDYPATEAAFEELKKQNVAFRESCIDMTGPLIHYMDTISIAKDFEAVRKAIGEENLSFVGTSYGTQLASQYAELFPENIRAVVLDGCVSLSPSQTMQFTLGATDVDAVLKSFFWWCSQQSTTECPLNHKNRSLQTMWTDLMARADESPIPMPVCEDAGVTCVRSALNANDIRAVVQHDLYDFPNFPYIAVYLAQTYFQNNASGFAPYYYAASPKESRYGLSPSWALTAVGCLDRYGDSEPSFEKFKEIFAESEAPLLNGIGPVSQFQRNCIGWPAPTRNPPHVISIPETPKMKKIFMTNNLFDPATPYGGAVNLQQEIGDRAVLVTRNATGHSMFLKPDAYHGPTMDALVKYLLSGEVPAEGAFFQN